MKSKLFILFTISFILKATGQKSDTLNVDPSYRLYSKCFENLNYGSEIIEKYPALKKSGLCSIQDCVISLAFKEDFIQEIAKARLRGIATQLFRQGSPVILISGMDSYSTALEENKNTDDDDKIVYISVGECVIPRYISIGQEVFNEQTRKLLAKK